MIPIRENLKKSIFDTIRYVKINFKINYINAQYINMTKSIMTVMLRGTISCGSGMVP
jgi:hypothetical protein